jgi:hypothetical protein
MVQGVMLLVHVRRPIGEDIRQFRSIPDAKGEIDVRPSIFARSCCRTSDRSATDAMIFGGVFQNVGTQAFTFF